MSREMLRGRVAIITGAGQGLGRAVAREFANEGCAVALVDINPQTLSAAEAELRAKGQTVRAMPWTLLTTRPTVKPLRRSPKSGDISTSSLTTPP